MNNTMVKVNEDFKLVSSLENGEQGLLYQSVEDLPVNSDSENDFIDSFSSI